MSGDDSREIFRTVDLALRVGEVVMSSGAGAADVYAAVLAVTRAGGLRHVHLDITFGTLTISVQPEPEAPPQTYVRTVTYRGLDYGLLTEVDHLVRALANGDIEAPTASRRLNEIRSAARPYPRWAVSAATGLMAAGIGLLLQGDLLVVAIAFVTAVLIDQLLQLMSRHRIPNFYQRVAGALLATVVAQGLYILDVPVSPSVIVAAGIVLLLAGITIVGAVQDAITGYYVTASARMFEALLLTGGIIAGVSMGLALSIRLGYELPLTARAGSALNDLPLALVGGTLVAVGFALTCYAPLRALLPIAVTAATAQAIDVVLGAARLGQAASASAAAVLVGVISFALAGRFRVPPLVVIVSGIVGLLPGLTIYRGLFLLLTEKDQSGFFALLTAASVGVGLAAGVLLGEYVAQPLKREARRLENRLAGPRLVGPLRLPSRRERRERKAQRRVTRRHSNDSADTAD